MDFPKIKPEGVVERLADAIRANPHYALGKGPLKPQDPMPSACDCSAFVCWLLGIPKFVIGDNSAELWFNTSGLLDHALDLGFSSVRKQPPASIPGVAVGSVLVWPRETRSSAPLPGHCGIVVSGARSVEYELGSQLVAECCSGVDGIRVLSETLSVFERRALKDLPLYLLDARR